MSGIVDARTLYVGDAKSGAEFQKIQDAVKIAEPGDNIVVYSGTYKETVSFLLAMYLCVQFVSKIHLQSVNLNLLCSCTDYRRPTYVRLKLFIIQ
jgi:hypothetical protein